MFRFRLVEQVNHLGTTLTTRYEGFTHHITKANVKDHTLVIAWLDGEQEYWIVEGQEGIEELKRLYTDMVGVVPTFSFMREVP